MDKLRVDLGEPSSLGDANPNLCEFCDVEPDLEEGAKKYPSEWSECVGDGGGISVVQGYSSEEELSDPESDMLNYSTLCQ